MQLKGMMYYTFANMRHSLLIFWSIICGILLLTFGADLIFGNDGSDIYFSFSVPVYVYAGIIGFWLVRNVLPYLLKLGSTRKNIYLGMGVSLFGISIFNALLANTIYSLVKLFYGPISSGKITVETAAKEFDTITFSHIVNFVGNDTWVNRVFIDITISFFFIAIMFVLGLIFYRYHLVGGLGFVAVIIFLNILGAAKGITGEWLISIFTDFSMVFFLQLFTVGILIYLISFVLLRKMTV